MRLFALGGALLLGIQPGSCLKQEETGFVEVKRQFAQASTGVYRLNGEDIAGLNGTAGVTSVVMKQKTGPITMEFHRDGRIYTLCDFPLARNRIVTVTLFLDNREIRCRVEK